MIILTTATDGERNERRMKNRRKEKEREGSTYEMNRIITL
jgi:hypothetical protein